MEIVSSLEIASRFGFQTSSSRPQRMSATAVERCLSVVEALVDESAGVSLVDLAARLDMPNSAIHRTLAILASRGYVRQDPATQAYALTLRLSTLGFRLLGARHLPDAGQQVLQRLAEQTGEYCRLAVVEGDGLTWISRAQGSTQGLRYEPPMGGEVVLHTTATGKAWLATLPEDEALRLVVAAGMGSRSKKASLASWRWPQPFVRPKILARPLPAPSASPDRCFGWGRHGVTRLRRSLRGRRAISQRCGLFASIRREFLEFPTREAA
jgi:hypothetical protein